jgi:cell wall-associated NlpC family hydrolase
MKPNKKKFPLITSIVTLMMVPLSFLSSPATVVFADSFTSPTSTTPATTSASQAENLSYGMSGSAVATLQQNLQTLGYFQYSSVTGYFGPVTKRAVLNFQTAYGLRADGIVGPLTRTAITHALVMKQLATDSLNYIGVPYHWGGTSPDTGFDCSGFVYYLFQKHGITSVPRTSSAQLDQMGTAIDRNHLQPGDLVFFSLSGNGAVSHVGIYLGDGKFVSPLSSKGVYVQTLDNPYWAPKYVNAKRLY